MNATATTLRKLAELAERMTPGEWKMSTYRPFALIARSPKESTYDIGDDKYPPIVYPNSAEDATGIAALKNFATPATLRALAALATACEKIVDVGNCMKFSKIHADWLIKEILERHGQPSIQLLAKAAQDEATAALAALGKETP